MAFPTAIKDDRVNEIRELYYDKGWCAREIADYLGVGLRTVYRFMSRHGMDRRGYVEANQAAFIRKPPSFQVPDQLSDELEKLRIAGVLLYWAEGSKNHHQLDFANSDVHMAVIFLRFLREVCRVDESRLRSCIYCHSNQNPKKIMRFWSEVLKLPLGQFTKPYVRVYSDGRHQGKVAKRPQRMKNGLVHIRYSDKKLLNQINSWISEYKTIWVGGRVDKRTWL